jgi:hypothetical protein
MPTPRGGVGATKNEGERGRDPDRSGQDPDRSGRAAGTTKLEAFFNDLHEEALLASHRRSGKEKLLQPDRNRDYWTAKL